MFLNLNGFKVVNSCQVPGRGDEYSSFYLFLDGPAGRDDDLLQQPGVAVELNLSIADKSMGTTSAKAQVDSASCLLSSCHCYLVFVSRPDLEFLTYEQSGQYTWWQSYLQQ